MQRCAEYFLCTGVIATVSKADCAKKSTIFDCSSQFTRNDFLKTVFGVGCFCPRAVGRNEQHDHGTCCGEVKQLFHTKKFKVMEIEGTRNLKNLGGPCSLFLMGEHLLSSAE